MEGGRGHALGGREGGRDNMLPAYAADASRPLRSAIPSLSRLY
jgi:hypothetical protein